MIQIAILYSIARFRPALVILDVVSVAIAENVTLKGHSRSSSISYYNFLVVFHCNYLYCIVSDIQRNRLVEKCILAGSPILILTKGLMGENNNCGYIVGRVLRYNFCIDFPVLA